MKENKYLLLCLLMLGIFAGYVGKEIVAENGLVVAPGAAVIQSPVISSAVWAITASTTPGAWSAYEFTGNLYGPSDNTPMGTSTLLTVGATSTQLLSENFGRAGGAICNESASNGWISFSNTVTSTYSYAVGSSTVINSNYFVAGNGRFVAAGTCYDLNQ